ncbi:LOW QUALITY PROTEIN: glutathione S-transferase rho [Menidia menidia]
MAQEMTLLWGSGSPPCWRVQIALEEKKLQGYNQKLLSFEKMEHKSREVLDMNPRGQLPTFKHGDTVVNESYAACFYLESQFPAQGTKLIPDSAGEQALMYQRMFEGLTFYEKLNAVIYYDWFVPKEEQHASALKRHREALSAELRLWEGYLEQLGPGPHLAGPAFSLADVVVFPTVATLFRFGLCAERYPLLGAYFSRLKDRPSVTASWPPHWLENSEGQDTLKDPAAAAIFTHSSSSCIPPAVNLHCSGNMAKEMTLLWGSGSPPCWRVQIALEEKKLQGYNQKLLSFEKMEHKSQQVLDMNPRGQLPAFKHGNSVLNESYAACLYLENQFKSQGTQLVPDSPGEVALMYQRMFEGMTLGNKMADVIYYNWKVPEGERHDSALKRNREALKAEIQLWEGYLKGSGCCLAGKSFSLADVIVYPAIAYLFRFGLSEEQFPKLAAYYNSLKGRASIKATWPPTWVESPGSEALKDL